MPAKSHVLRQWKPKNRTLDRWKSGGPKVRTGCNDRRGRRSGARIRRTPPPDEVQCSAGVVEKLRAGCLVSQLLNIQTCKYRILKRPFCITSRLHHHGEGKTGLPAPAGTRRTVKSGDVLLNWVWF